MATASSIAFTVEFPLRVVLYPAPDLPRQWIAHGLETDVVTQGDSVDHALAMMADALDALVRYQTDRRRPLLRLRPAPIEVWELADEARPAGLTARIERRRRRASTAASVAEGPWTLYGLVSRRPPSPRAR